MAAEQDLLAVCGPRRTRVIRSVVRELGLTRAVRVDRVDLVVAAVEGGERDLPVRAREGSVRGNDQAEQRDTSCEDDGYQARDDGSPSRTGPSIVAQSQPSKGTGSGFCSARSSAIASAITPSI
jgi:hypothetical protein